jgi:hypothetical protein
MKKNLIILFAYDINIHTFIVPIPSSPLLSPFKKMAKTNSGQITREKVGKSNGAKKAGFE